MIGTARLRVAAVALLAGLGSAGAAMAPTGGERELTQRVGIAADQARDFWPVYTEYRYELAKLDGQRRRLLDDVMRRVSSLDDDQANEFIEGWLDLERDELKLAERFVKQFRRVLDDDQVARLVLLEASQRAVGDVQLLEVVEDRWGSMQSDEPEVTKQKEKRP